MTARARIAPWGIVRKAIDPTVIGRKASARSGIVRLGAIDPTATGHAQIAPRVIDLSGIVLGGIVRPETGPLVIGHVLTAHKEIVHSGTVREPIALAATVPMVIAHTVIARTVSGPAAIDRVKIDSGIARPVRTVSARNARALMIAVRRAGTSPPVTVDPRAVSR